MSTIPDPASAAVTILGINNEYQFGFDTTDKSNVVIVSVTNQIQEGINTITFTRYDGIDYQSFNLTGDSTFTAIGTQGGSPTPVSAASSMFEIAVNAEQSFVIEMTLSGAYVAIEESMYINVYP